MKQAIGILSLLLVLIGCGTSKVVRGIEGSPIPASKTTDQVESAIETGAASLGWKITDKKPGVMTADIQVRTHAATVEIKYDKNSYSITHKASTNLNYDPQRGTIHRNFNRWVAKLNQAIQQKL